MAETTPDTIKVTAKTDALIVSMIGAALCINTIKDNRWSAVEVLVEEMLKNILPSQK